MNPDELKALARSHAPEAIERLIELARGRYGATSMRAHSDLASRGIPPRATAAEIAKLLNRWDRAP